ncbi:MFS transporter [Viridothelium virens]|uniref:MFS transporter n=1 Tax=Viridothelium virens TaxID=1048519 RepID=A0A6A6HDE7_VIRVR|nr:MFS transporter [Viridothelium virens]
MQVLKASEAGNLKLAKDGVTILIPQPSDDPDDPLNWSWTQKHLALIPLIFASLLTDFSITWGSVLFQAQGPTFNMTPSAVSQSLSGSLFMMGPGGVLAVPLIQRFGRLPVVFWSQILAALTVMAAAVSPNYACFTAFRTLQGFVCSPPQVVGLSIVHDMFFFHERARKVNIWVLCFLGGPFLGPFIAAWLIEAVSWRADFGVLSGLFGFSAILVVLLGRETLYDRLSPQKKEAGVKGKLKLLTGVAGAQMSGRPIVWTVCKDLVTVQLRPQIFFLTVIFIMVLVAWVIGINTTISLLVVPPPYSFSPSAEAVSWVAPMIGAGLGELWGYWFNDFLLRRHLRTHEGSYTVENRLWGVYTPAVIAFVGLILYGQALQHTLHWIALLVAWACVAFGMIAATTAISAYCLDSFPNHSSLVASIINFWRTTGGFCVVYFQLKWIATSGAAVTFGCQGMILGVAFITGVVTTQIWGKRWRKKYPPPKAEN